MPGITRKRLVSGAISSEKRAFFMSAGEKDGPFTPLKKNEKEIHVAPPLHKPGAPPVTELWVDFINAIVKKRHPVCDIEIGHYSTTLSLLGILSWKLGRSVQWDGKRERCVNDPQADKLLRREYRKPWKYPEV